MEKRRRRLYFGQSCHVMTPETTIWRPKSMIIQSCHAQVKKSLRFPPKKYPYEYHWFSSPLPHEQGSADGNTACGSSTIRSVLFWIYLE